MSTLKEKNLIYFESEITHTFICAGQHLSFHASFLSAILSLTLHIIEVPQWQ